MRRIYGLVIGLAMLLAATGVAGADTDTRPAANQQAINLVIARALSQRGIPYTYGGGDSSGPTRGASRAVEPGAGTGAGALGIPQSAGPVAGVDTLAATITDPTAAGSTTNVIGYDASGLIVYAFAGAGIKMPRSSGQQYGVGRKVPPALALPGDLIFYGPDGSQSVALFVGNGQMLEAGNPVVTVSPVRTADMAPYLTRVIE